MTLRKYGVLSIPAVIIASAAFATIQDADGDGAYSYAEVLAEYPSLTEAVFGEIDADADGRLSVEELTGAIQSGALKVEG